MRYLITGANGQLGYDLVRELTSRGMEVLGTDIQEQPGYALPEGASYRKLDITDGAACEKEAAAYRPDVIIHGAAWTAVDAAEDEENQEKVFAINEGGTANIARAASACGAKLIYISTDYVFDGTGEKPWTADEENYGPKNVYGMSKLAGEKAVRTLTKNWFIVRIAWVFGKNGSNFVKTMLRVGKSHDEVRVVNDQFGTPTYTKDLARLLADMAETEKYGIYHATNEGGYISWYEFTKEIYRQAGLPTKVTPVTTEEYGLSKAVRPRNSRLDRSKLTGSGFRPLPDWQDAVKRYLKEIEE